jgi:hypothetical protein
LFLQKQEVIIYHHTVTHYSHCGGKLKVKIGKLMLKKADTTVAANAEAIYGKFSHIT